MATFTLSKDVNFQLGGFEFSASAGEVTCPDDLFEEIESLIGAEFISGTTYDRDSAGLGGVTLSGTPTTGQVITASSSSAASWATPSGGSTSFTSIAKWG